MPTSLSYRAKLTRSETATAYCRTKELNGLCTALPALGRRFYIFSDPQVRATNPKYVRTSPVIRIAGGGDTFVFWTKNSRYVLEVHEAVLNDVSASFSSPGWIQSENNHNALH